MEANEFALHYQPKVDAGSGRVIGVEALLRWQRQSGIVPPFKFIPILEDTGMIINVGRWVTTEACRQAVRHCRCRRPPRMNLQHTRHNWMPSPLPVVARFSGATTRFPQARTERQGR